MQCNMDHRKGQFGMHASPYTLRREYGCRLISPKISVFMIISPLICKLSYLQRWSLKICTKCNTDVISWGTRFCKLYFIITFILLSKLWHREVKERGLRVKVVNEYGMDISFHRFRGSAPNSLSILIHPTLKITSRGEGVTRRKLGSPNFLRLFLKYSDRRILRSFSSKNLKMLLRDLPIKEQPSWLE